MRHFSATLFRRGVAFAIGAAMVLLESGRASAGDVVRFQTDTFPSGEHAVYFGGWQKGIFAKHGIDITVSRGYGTVDTITKLPSGAFDFGLTDLGSVFLGRAREKLPVKAIAIIYRQSPSSIFVLKSSKITSLKDLEGKRIGGPPGGGTRALFPAAAALAGVDLSRVRWVNVDQAAVATQLIAKNIEAGTYYSVHYGAANAAAQQSGEEIRVLPYFDSKSAIYADVIATTERTLRERPDLVRRFLLAVKESFQWAKDHPEDTCKAYLVKVPENTLDGCLATLNAALKFAFSDDEKQLPWGRESAERTITTWKTIARTYGLDEKADPKSALDTSLIPAK